jgi:hypothetical protein
MPASAAASVPAAPHKRRIIVHLGFPKTASTTIQAMLAANAGRFGPGIVVSPKDDLTRKLRKNALRFMRSGGKAWFRWRHAVATREMVRKIDAMAFETLLISDENMVGIESGKIFDPPGKTDFVAWVQRFDQGGPARIVEELRGILGARLKTFEMAAEVGPDKLMGRYLLELAGASPEQIAAVVVPPHKNESLPAAAIEFLQLVHKNPKLRGARYRFLVRLCAQNPELFSRDYRA